jgi:HD superfamily phosphodiesterase
MDDIPKWLWEYAETIISKYSFDSSHDMQHFINVYKYSKDIILSDYSYLLIKDSELSNETNIIFPKDLQKLTNEQIRNIIYHAAFCHDLIDAKYVNSQEEISNLRKVFLANGYDKKHLEIIIFIIDNISYSKQRLGYLQIPLEYEIFVNIVSDADKLDAYRIERVIAYQENKHKDLDEPERTIKNLSWIKTILVKRILTYKDFWLKTNYAKKISVELHNSVQLYVDTHLSSVEMCDY